MFFLLILLDDRGIWIQIRIRISDLWIRMRIREAQKHMDPADPDPQHWKEPKKNVCWIEKAESLLSPVIDQVKLGVVPASD